MIVVDLKALGQPACRWQRKVQRLPAEGNFLFGSSLREKDADYFRVVAYLGKERRLAVCRDGWQWLLQCTRGKEWRAERYLRDIGGLAQVMGSEQAAEDLLVRFRVQGAGEASPEASQGISEGLGIPALPKDARRTQRRIPEPLRGTQGAVTRSPSTRMASQAIR